MDATSTTTTAKGEHESKLSASLKSRHLTMMSIAGVIGGALFVGSGSVIHSAGPAAVLAYLAGGILVVLIMRMLGEMATSSPDIPAAGRQGGHHGSRHQLDLGLKARMCRQSACHGPQRNHQQVKRSGRQFGYHQHACHQPPLRTFIHETLRFFLVLVQRPHRGQQNHHIARTG